MCVPTQDLNGGSNSIHSERHRAPPSGSSTDLDFDTAEDANRTREGKAGDAKVSYNVPFIPTAVPPAMRHSVSDVFMHKEQVTHVPYRWVWNGVGGVELRCCSVS